jgi:hypothetical protein
MGKDKQTAESSGVVIMLSITESVAVTRSSSGRSEPDDDDDCELA